MASSSIVVVKDLQDALEKESRAKMMQIGEAYDEVMRGNKEVEARLKAEEDVMIRRLKEVQFQLREIKRTRDENKGKQPRKKDLIYSCYTAGKPYFKDRNFNQPPPNEDTKIMKQCDMYDFSTVMSVSGWNFGDTSNLRRVLLRTAQERETKRLYSQLALLTRMKTKNNMIKTKIDEIMSDISNMKYKKLSELDPSSYENFDWDEVALELNREDRRHSAREYKSIWKLLLQPSVKMDKWSANEHLELQRLAREYNMQNWDAIAKELNIQRTGYQCFVYYRTNMDHAASGRKWTIEEMDRLRDVIISHQEDYHIPWGKVAALMPNRTKVQCYNKYMRMFERRKGRFCDEEDAVIQNYVNVFGANYKNMVQFMFGRSSVQCRNRHYLLKRPGPSATWTEKDDEKLLLTIANSDGPCTFAAAAQHFGPGKERTHLRSRYHTLKNWIKKHPHSPTRNAPRRAPRRLPHGEPTTNLITALENLRIKINELTNEPASQPKPKNNRLCRDSSHAVLNSALRTQITSHHIKLLLQQNISKDTMQVRSSDSVRALPTQDIGAARSRGKEVYHLNLLLYVLNTRIADKDRFQESEHGQGFKELEEMEKQGLVKKDQGMMRSYSRKGLVDAEPVICPNLYNGTVAGRRKFLLPPNLATLTASRVLLSHVHKQLQQYSTLPNPPQPFDLKRTLRRKPTARAAIFELRERFNDLFVWPYNLSNNAPDYYSNMEQESQKKLATVPAKRYHKMRIPDVPMVTIPTQPQRSRTMVGKKYVPPKPKPVKETKRIDLDEKEVRESIEKTKISLVPVGECGLNPLGYCGPSFDTISDEPLYESDGLRIPTISEEPRYVSGGPTRSFDIISKEPVYVSDGLSIPTISEEPRYVSGGPTRSFDIISKEPVYVSDGLSIPTISEEPRYVSGGPTRSFDIISKEPVYVSDGLSIPTISEEPRYVSGGPTRSFDIISKEPVYVSDGLSIPTISEEPRYVSGGPTRSFDIISKEPVYVSDGLSIATISEEPRYVSGGPTRSFDIISKEPVYVSDGLSIATISEEPRYVSGGPTRSFDIISKEPVYVSDGLSIATISEEPRYVSGGATRSFDIISKEPVYVSDGLSIPTISEEPRYVSGGPTRSFDIISKEPVYVSDGLSIATISEEPRYVSGGATRSFDITKEPL